MARIFPRHFPFIARIGSLAVPPAPTFEQWVTAGAERAPLPSLPLLPIADIEAGKINLVIDQVVQGVVEGAGEKLPLQINGDKARAGVDVLVTRHEHPSRRTSAWSLVV